MMLHALPGPQVRTRKNMEAVRPGSAMFATTSVPGWTHREQEGGVIEDRTTAPLGRNQPKNRTATRRDPR